MRAANCAREARPGKTRRRRHPPGSSQHRADLDAAFRRPQRDPGATRMSRLDKLLLGGAVLVLVVVYSLMIYSM
ncbi:MAG: hypothetical protein OXE02_14050 [Chloroflexi bacterium]|nr:hypothetical protein [Chloroflexota bacterium]